MTKVRMKVKNWLDQPTTRRAGLGPWFGVLVTMIVSFGIFDYNSEACAYDQCTARVQGREDVRTVLTGFIIRLSDSEADSASLILLLDTVLEELNVDETCDEPTWLL